MPRKFLSIKEVDDTTYGWTVIVQVVERSHVMVSRNNTLFMRFLLTDAQGTLVSAVVHGSDIEKFDDSLLPFKRYQISLAMLKKVDPMYKVGDYEYSWTIGHKTLVEELDDPIPQQLPCQFQLTRFSDLYKYADTEKPLNVMGIIVHALPEKKNPGSVTRDFVIVNEEKKMMLFTLWNDFITNEGTQLANNIANSNVIIAMRVKVTTFNGLSLSTKWNSAILVEPPTAQTTILKEWYKTNKDFVINEIQEEAYKDTDKLLPPPEDADIKTVAHALNTLSYEKTVWVKGVLHLADQRSFWQSVCNKCQKSINALLGWDIKCSKCKQEATVEPRCRLRVLINDGTGTINVSLKGKDAEKIIPFNAYDLSKAEEEGVNLTATIEDALKKSTVVCFIRHYDNDSSSQKGMYSVVQLLTINEIDAAKKTSQNDAHEIQKSKQVLPSLSLKNSVLCSSENSVKEEQFFSPSTRVVLESTVEKCETSKGSSKRALLFDDDAMETETAPSKVLPTESCENISPAKKSSPAGLKKPREKME